MKKIVAFILALFMLSCAAAEEAPKVAIGNISINGAFSLQCSLMDGYSVTPISVNRDQIIARIASADKTKPEMVLSVAFDEIYSEVDRLNDLTNEELSLIEETFTVVDPTIEITYDETRYGTRLLVAKQLDDTYNYVDFFTIYKGYFVEFILTAGEKAEDKTLTEDQIRMCVDFLSDLDFIPTSEAEESLNVAGKSYQASLSNYDRGFIDVTIREPIVLSEETVQALQVGGELVIGQETISVETMSTEDDIILINDEIEIRKSDEGYLPYFYDAAYMKDIDTLHCQLTEDLVFLDNIDEETGEMLEETASYGLDEFVKLYENENDPGFATDNVNVSFDENGQLSTIERIYVPWQ